MNFIPQPHGRAFWDKWFNAEKKCYDIADGEAWPDPDGWTWEQRKADIIRRSTTYDVFDSAVAMQLAHKYSSDYMTELLIPRPEARVAADIARKIHAKNRDEEIKWFREQVKALEAATGKTWEQMQAECEVDPECIARQKAFDATLWTVQQRKRESKL